MTLKKTILALALISVCFFSTGINASAQAGSEALPFSRINRDPVFGGMGYAGTASTASTAYSSFYNAATVPFAPGKMDVAAAFQSWAPDLSGKSTNINVGGSYKIGEKFGITAGFAHQSGTAYDVTDGNGSIDGTYTPTDMQLNVGAAYKFTDKIGAGVNLRYLSSSLSDDNSYSSIAADAFVMYKTGNLNVALGVSDLGSGVKSDNGDSFSLPSSVTAAGSYSMTFSKVHGIEADLDADYYLSGNMTAAFGAQYSYNDLVFARAGYHFGSDEAVLPSFATVGLGVKIKGIHLDFSYLLGSDTLGGTMSIGLGYKF